MHIVQKPHAFIAEIGEVERCQWPNEKQLERQVRNGYVYAINECDTNMIFISWESRIPIRMVLARLQKGNPRQLKVLRVLIRSNMFDAQEICKVIHRGLILNNIKGDWFDVSQDSIVNMFNSIDNPN